MKFFKTILSVFSFQVLEKIVRQFNSIILARWVGPSSLGVYTLFFTLAQNIFIFFEFGLGAAGIYNIRRKKSIQIKVIENTISFSIIIGFFSSLALFIFRDYLSNSLLEGNSFYILLLALVLPVIMISSILSIIVRGLFRFDIFNTYLILKPICFLILISIMLIVFNGNILSAIYSQILSIFIAGGWIFYKIYKLEKIKLRFHFNTFLVNLKYGIKQHILKISLMILSSVQIYILRYFTDSNIVGQYGIVLSIIGMISFIKMSISLVLTPKVSELTDNNVHNTIAKVTRNTLFLTIIASVLIYLLGSFYVSLFYGDKFNYAAENFYWFIPGVIFHSSCVILHRDFTSRETPKQFIPILAYSIGAIVISILSFIFLNVFNDNALKALGLAYNFSHLICLLILSFIFKFDTGISIFDFLLIKKSDFIYYKNKFIFIFHKLKK
jgi:O-antigen/teichoic acid export membrane protein